MRTTPHCRVTLTANQRPSVLLLPTPNSVGRVEGITMAKPKITLTRVMRAVEQDDCLGFCTACGAKAHNVEPDAREYACESCGEPKVYGAEELLFMAEELLFMLA